MKDVYHRLAEHLAGLVMGYPFHEPLIDLLKEMFDPTEAEAALAIPNDMDPLEVAGVDEIASRSELPREMLKKALAAMADRNMLFSRTMPDGRTGYALLQVGYGQPQAHFWAGVSDDERARRMAKAVIRYFSVPVTQKIYGGATVKTFKYSPSGLAVEVPMQGVLPNESIGPILAGADKIALAHCPCRVSALTLGRTECTHSLEVCFKYDEMAEFVISKGLAREVSKDEALSVMKACEEEGLVHMVDNVQGRVKHTCNCCGHWCWNVGIIRRRKIPRDQLMAVYFTRETEESECIGCGACEDVCPVDAVRMENGLAVTDSDWCIGCGVCMVRCPAGAISIRRRDLSPPPKDFRELCSKIRMERSSG